MDHPLPGMIIHGQSFPWINVLVCPTWSIIHTLQTCICVCVSPELVYSKPCTRPPKPKDKIPHFVVSAPIYVWSFANAVFRPCVLQTLHNPSWTWEEFTPLRDLSWIDLTTSCLILWDCCLQNLCAPKPCTCPPEPKEKTHFVVWPELTSPRTVGYLLTPVLNELAQEHPIHTLGCFVLPWPIHHDDDLQYLQECVMNS